MSFSETLKLEIRRKAHFKCCLCRTLGVEIHHIVPQSEGGADDEDNAAPLCPTCHEIYGSNPVKRKFIREVRDFWYKHQEQFAPVSNRLSVIEKKLDTIATKQDLDKVIIQNTGTYAYELEISPYSFVRDEFIHPLIVKELLGWLSDPAETVIAIDLKQSNHSNRFFGPFSVRTIDGRLWVEFDESPNGFFNYSYIATSPSGVHMVECCESGGGTGRFGSIILLTLQYDRALFVGDNNELRSRERILLKTLGSINLGDRYYGDITYKDGMLIVGPDKGWFQRGAVASKQIAIK